MNKYLDLQSDIPHFVDRRKRNEETEALAPVFRFHDIFLLHKESDVRILRVEAPILEASGLPPGGCGRCRTAENHARQVCLREVELNGIFEGSTDVS